MQEESQYINLFYSYTVILKYDIGNVSKIEIITCYSMFFLKYFLPFFPQYFLLAALPTEFFLAVLPIIFSTILPTVVFLAVLPTVFPTVFFLAVLPTVFPSTTYQQCIKTTQYRGLQFLTLEVLHIMTYFAMVCKSGTVCNSQFI